LHRRWLVVVKLIGVSGIDFVGVLVAVSASPTRSCSCVCFDDRNPNLVPNSLLSTLRSAMR
jgi:hypothetical protein